MTSLYSNYVGHLVRGLRFASLLCEALGQPAYVTLAGVVPNTTSFAAVGDWAWKKPDQPSRAPFAANAKLAELIWAGAPDRTKLVLTPIPEFDLGLGWMGGARLAELIVAVSKWSEEHDRLLALLVLYSLQQEVRLHHVGTRYPSIEQMYAASLELDLPQIALPAEDHVRVYHRVEAPHAPNRCYYLETQFFPNGPHDIASHWDLVTSNPAELLYFVAAGFNTQPVMWYNAGLNEPMGVVWIPDKQGKHLGVMARGHWWNPENYA